MPELPTENRQPFEELRPKKVKRHLRRFERVSLKHAHTFIIRRWQNVQEVRRNALVWLLLMAVLIGTIVTQAALSQRAYRADMPAPGGVYAEGVIGKIDTLNPIFASTPAEDAAAKLIFDGLLGYDVDGKLRLDMAQNLKITNHEKTYTVTLKPNLKWQDGRPLTAGDVVFTIDTIKNLQVQSPFYQIWREVQVKAIDQNTVQFNLVASFAPFPHLLTQAIIPAHAFDGVLPQDFRNAAFSQDPIGSGPFIFRSMQTINLETGRKTINLLANADYYLGQPELARFQIQAYPDTEGLQKGIKAGEINAAAGLAVSEVAELSSDEKLKITDIPLNSAALAIFKTHGGVLSDKKIRQALRLATDRPAIVKKLNDRVLLMDTPIPPNMVNGLSKLKQPTYNLKTAAKILQSDGWKVGPNGKRFKKGQPLTINVATVKAGDYPTVLAELAEQWNKLGVDVQANIVDPENAQQSLLEPRAYDVLVYEMAIEGDPDVFAFWESSRATANGLNLANYQSDIVDDALSSARSVSNLRLRTAKYNTFVKEWLNDVPAVVLYRPMLHYASSQSSELPEITALPDYGARFYTVNDWLVNKKLQNLNP